MRRWLVVAIVAGLADTTMLLAQAYAPRPTGFISDRAELLDATAEAEIEKLLDQLERDTTAELMVATVPSLNGVSASEYANQLFAHWQTGKKGLDNGVLVVVAPAEREMFIEVGYGLEGILPDGLAGEVVRDAFLPRFKENNYRQGIREGADRLAAIVRAGHVLTPEERKRFESAGAINPWYLLPLFALFTGGGAFAVGVGIGSRTFGAMAWGLIFGGSAVVMAALILSVLLTALVPFSLAMAWWGAVLARRPGWLAQLRGTAKAGTTNWILGEGTSTTGGRRGGSSAESAGRSSRRMGGGRSGGGGAGGSW
jgi:uncharacterized protein